MITKLMKHQGSIPYTMHSREVIQAITNPDSLSIWSYLQSLPEDWSVNETHIRDHFGIGRTRYLSAMKYLRDMNLYSVERLSDGQNFTGAVFHIYPFPHVWDSTHIETDTYIKEKDIPTEKDIPKEKKGIAENDFERAILKHRATIKKTLKSRKGLTALVKAIEKASQAWSKTPEEILDLMEEKEWLSVNGDWSNPFDTKHASKYQAPALVSTQDMVGGDSWDQL
ncbi:MAG: hypothetical protein PF450_03285 [Bacteroidales bacterium]|jgi:predicted RNase H-like nuclease (RuvC/YqgF family)|nr:hypothetical protein [Bacteroidales bacterium]